MRLLRNSDIARLLQITVGADEGEDDDDGYARIRLRRRGRADPNRFPKIPSENGQELMNSGQFGSNETENIREGEIIMKKKLARRILDRELATVSYSEQQLNQRLMAQVSWPVILWRKISSLILGNDTINQCGYNHKLQSASILGTILR